MNFNNINNLSNHNQTKTIGADFPILKNDLKHSTELKQFISNNINYEISKEDKKLLLNKINSLNIPISLLFKVDESSGTNIIQFIDPNNNKVIKQIPTKEIIKIIQQIDLFLSQNTKKIPLGILLNERI